MALSLHSTAFQQGMPIPSKYTGDGEDLSPPLSWNSPPDGTRQLALICDDPDAPSPEPWVHWVIYGIAADVTSLPEGITTSPQIDEPVAAMQGKNSWTSGMTVGYRGPAPPRGHGVHLSTTDPAAHVVRRPARHSDLFASRTIVNSTAQASGWDLSKKDRSCSLALMTCALAHPQRKHAHTAAQR